MAKAQNYIGVGKKHILGEGDTAHTFMMGETIWVGTPHNIERKSLAVGGQGVGGRVGG